MKAKNYFVSVKSLVKIYPIINEIKLYSGIARLKIIYLY